MASYIDTPAGSPKSEFRRYPHKAERVIVAMSRDKDEMPLLGLSEEEAMYLASHTISPWDLDLHTPCNR